MAWVHSIPLPLGIDAEVVETVQELQRITCLNRCFAEVGANTLFVHFEAVEDAITFMDTFTFLLESMSRDDAAITVRDEFAGEVVC
ncbi:MAG: hypothetical protein ACK4NA_07035 [Alphaproteobacteria bacterium]